MSKQDKRRASLAGNAAIRKLAVAFELQGLAPMLAFNHACKVVGDARLHVENVVAALAGLKVG